MSQPIVLASGSEARRRMLSQAGVPFEVVPARVDEEAARAGLQAEGAGPRDVADALAEMKARRVSGRTPGALVLGCDQILELDGEILAKADDPAALRAQLARLRGRRHALLSACVVYEDGAPLWRHVGVARLHMRAVSDQYLDDYVDRLWDEVRSCVGGYQIEGEGVRLMDRIEGDLFTVMGLPLLPLLSWLTLRGTLAG